jgi:adenylylsulfate kinase
MKVLIFGLPGAGKTWLAERLQKELKCAWYNADEVRKMANDWEFSDEARIRQARRMRNIADYEKGCGRDVICDFVCPTELTRHIFEADITVWVDTIEEGRFEDTNKAFERPNIANVDFHITKHLSEEDGEVASLAVAIEQRYVLDTECIPI